MSESSMRLLRQFSDEIVTLAEKIVPSTAIVTGQTRDLLDGGGSAWLYDAEHLVTNNHVVDNLVEPIHVQFPGGRRMPARVIATDPLTDLAVLRVDPQTVAPCKFQRQGQSSESYASPSAVR